MNHDDKMCVKRKKRDHIAVPSAWGEECSFERKYCTRIVFHLFSISSHNAFVLLEAEIAIFVISLMISISSCFQKLNVSNSYCQMAALTKHWELRNSNKRSIKNF